MSKSTAKTGTLEQLLEGVDAEKTAIVHYLREQFLAIHPDAFESFRLGDNAAHYGVGPSKMKEGYGYIMAHKKWVNLGFYHGAHLPDPNGLLDGTGKNLRHVKVHTLEAAQQPAITALIQAALDERAAAVGTGK